MGTSAPIRRTVYEPEVMPRRIPLPEPDPVRWVTPLPSVQPERISAPAAPSRERVPA